ncbi:MULTISPECIES: HyaD/HybD family hydrogenase maturation endopeptidase [unclassified Shewanella]|uniref:HyaD/HybD family hydrogenase maturation endopeptidase n=1 Tax=unclassified Shewanella TaxID=196818 RepID=UPI000C827363|nr:MULTISPECIES: HyaD/HybD family hydrogenase maturation endopeptidase [unclassified Shewanella]MDO6618341.1 HyaD/HybD family hydrogenase maturation endopeptidase [Shewanella sp. 6_MG-2023]MDO6679254.1 HyaD/HybD family hydrogenase maturation endopeptidase [Shewanella sp. 4_MG-2023]MDO6776410.1 HyaD/HybD family hydrogenase maturation endopeptidase [Shewanella sp. 3_MG-2023]PMG28394.1 hydrogenase expression/formation protein [Shewanella sp. 10N.286.52.C2]PMG47403.1 hydrogenase expression/formati
MSTSLLIGIGNVLYADEGIGVHFVNYIDEKYAFYQPNHQLDILDGGTLAQGLIPILCQYDNLIVVDTVNSPGVKPGEVYSFNFDQAPPEIDWQGSAHEVEMLQTLIMMDMVGDRPNTHVIGVTPTVIEPMTLGLTESIQAAVPTMEKALLAHLEKAGFSYTKKHSVNINDLIPDSYKRGCQPYA